MDSDDFSDDPAITKKLANIRESIKKIEGLITIISNEKLYTSLSLKQKVDYDLFVSYTLNTLFWLYLRTKNEDPNKSDIKHQLTRVKEYMVKAKQAHERQTIRPKIDQPAADRFVKHGINYKNKRNDEAPPNKIIKFSY